MHKTHCRPSEVYSCYSDSMDRRACDRAYSLLHDLKTQLATPKKNCPTEQNSLIDKLREQRTLLYNVMYIRCMD